MAVLTMVMLVSVDFKSCGSRYKKKKVSSKPPSGQDGEDEEITAER